MQYNDKHILSIYYYLVLLDQNVYLLSTILKFITSFLFVIQPLLFYLIVTFEDFLLFLSLTNLDQNTPTITKTSCIQQS